AVASVDSNGVVIGVSEGSAIITVTTTDGGKIASCIVTVSKVAIPVASVSIKESTSLTVKAAEKLTATILPSNATTQTVSWKSDKPAVASVDSNGIVTGISQGSATITVTTTDGNKYDTCIVTVYDTALPISPVMTFNDLPNTHWSYTAITELSKYGIVKGFTDGSFQPRSNVSREEFAAMLHRCVNPLEIENPAVPSFKDIQGRWSYLEIEAVKEFFEGTQKSDGLYFNPINNAKREDIIYSLVKAKGYQDESYDISTLSVFTDKADISPDKVKYVAIAYKLGLVKGASVDGKLLLNPKLGVTRAETAQFLYNAFIK
ncbi:MAG: S-layer homology domain-containing protein, partial [Deltaproteobacteria bacterium]